ncbi:MAG: hypothetical protein ACD_15C00137G0012 [uncultured bacterium]|nr:MAG: hypothetical protein ACD_15C00137G0012 [uncultured bacterium]
MFKVWLSKIKNNLILVDILSVGFLLGYVFGYSHFFDNMSVHFLDVIIQNLKLFKGILVMFQPNPDFLSDVAAFEAAVVAFLIPLSIEIISKVSERYESEITVRVFEKRLSNRWLPYLLMLNIGLAVILRFSNNSTNGSSGSLVVLSWLTLIFFISMAFMILQVIMNIKKFMTDKQFIIKELINDAKKSLE